VVRESSAGRFAAATFIVPFVIYAVNWLLID